MDDSTNNRYGTRSAANPTQLAEASTTIKQEPIDEDVPDSRPKEPSAATMQEASSSNCSSRDPLADEIEFGETGISFQNAFFNVVGNEIKTENIIAEEIEDNGDIVGSSTKRRKICEEDSGDDSSATRSTQQSIPYGRMARSAEHTYTDQPANPPPQTSNSTTQLNGKDEDNCTYVIQVLNDTPKLATEQAQPKERLKVLTPNILNCNLNAKYSINTTASSNVKQTQAKNHVTPKMTNCTHCACFDKFVTEHNRKVDQFLVKQQKIVNDMFKVQQTILEKLQHIESNQTKQFEAKHDKEAQSDEEAHSLPDANEFLQLPEYAFQMPHIPPDEEQHQHTGGEYSEEVQLYSFSRMQTEEELNDFEKRLSDPEYFKEAYNWLNSLITETNCGNRMLAALDLLFDKVFVNKCSWTGRGRGDIRKSPIRCRKNLLQLFKAIGSTRKAIVSRSDVEIFFIKKLKQSKQRLNMQGIRKATCHIKRARLVE